MQKEPINVSDVYEGFTAGTRIILDGVDVSDDCYRAEVFEDGTGRAYCYVKSGGQFVLDEAESKPVTEIRSGKVEIIRPKAAPRPIYARIVELEAENAELRKLLGMTNEFGRTNDYRAQE